MSLYVLPLGLFRPTSMLGILYRVERMHVKARVYGMSR